MDFCAHPDREMPRLACGQPRPCKYHEALAHATIQHNELLDDVPFVEGLAFPSEPTIGVDLAKDDEFDHTVITSLVSINAQLMRAQLGPRPMLGEIQVYVLESARAELEALTRFIYDHYSEI